MKGHKGFTKNDPNINRKGRGPDQKWYDLTWWYKLILDNYEKLTEKEKVELGLRGLALLISKLPNIPATPQESVANVVDVRNELEKMEANANSDKAGGDPVRMGTSETQVQAGVETKGGL